MENKKFQIGEAIKFGWGVAKNNIWYFVGLLIISFVASVFFELIDEIINNSLSFIFVILSLIVQGIISIGLIKITLNFADGIKSSYKELYANYKLFWKYLLATILFNLMVFAGIILLVVPGIYLAIKFMFYGYFIVEGKGPIEALKASSKITRDQKWQLFKLGAVSLGISILGFLALIVGLFIAIPTIMVAQAYVFRKLNADDLALSDKVSPPPAVQA